MAEIPEKPEGVLLADRYKYVLGVADTPSPTAMRQAVRTLYTKPACIEHLSADDQRRVFVQAAALFPKEAMALDYGKVLARALGKDAMPERIEDIKASSMRSAAVALASADPQEFLHNAKRFNPFFNDKDKPGLKYGDGSEAAMKSRAMFDHLLREASAIDQLCSDERKLTTKALFQTAAWWLPAYHGHPLGMEIFNGALKDSPGEAVHERGQWREVFSEASYNQLLAKAEQMAVEKSPGVYLQSKHDDWVKMKHDRSFKGYAPQESALIARAVEVAAKTHPGQVLLTHSMWCEAFKGNRREETRLLNIAVNNGVTHACGAVIQSYGIWQQASTESVLEQKKKMINAARRAQKEDPESLLTNTDEWCPEFLSTPELRAEKIQILKTAVKAVAPKNPDLLLQKAKLWLSAYDDDPKMGREIISSAVKQANPEVVARTTENWLPVFKEHPEKLKELLAQFTGEAKEKITQAIQKTIEGQPENYPGLQNISLSQTDMKLFHPYATLTERSANPFPAAEAEALPLRANITALDTKIITPSQAV